MVMAAMALTGTGTGMRAICPHGDAAAACDPHHHDDPDAALITVASF